MLQKPDFRRFFTLIYNFNDAFFREFYLCAQDAFKEIVHGATEEALLRNFLLCVFLHKFFDILKTALPDLTGEPFCL